MGNHKSFVFHSTDESHSLVIPPAGRYHLYVNHQGHIEVINSLGKVVNQSFSSTSTGTTNDIGLYRGKRTFTGTSDTLVLDDGGGLVMATNNGSVTITIPPQSSVAFPELVTVTCFSNSSNGQITFAPGSGVTLLSGGGALKTAMPYGGVSLTLIDASTNTWWIEGNLTV